MLCLNVDLKSPCAGSFSPQCGNQVLEPSESRAREKVIRSVGTMPSEGTNLVLIRLCLSPGEHTITKSKAGLLSCYISPPSPWSSHQSGCDVGSQTSLPHMSGCWCCAFQNCELNKLLCLIHCLVIGILQKSKKWAKIMPYL